MTYKRSQINRILSILLAFVLMVSVLSIQPTYAASKPAKVTGVTVSARTYNSITVKWKKAKRAKKYQIGYKVNGGTWKYKKVKSKYKSKKITGLSQYKKYSIRVRALNGKKKGKWSSTVSAYTCPKTYSWPELLVASNLRVERVGPGSIEVAWDTVQPADARIANAEAALDESQKKYDEIYALLNPEDEEESVVPEEPVDVEETAEIVSEDAQLEGEGDDEETTEPEPEGPTLEEQLEAATAELKAAEDKLNAEKTVKTNYDKCIFRIYRSTDNKNWSLFADNISNATRSYVCRRCDVGKTYYFKITTCDKSTYQTFSHNGTSSNVVSDSSKGIPGLKIKNTPTKNNYAYKENKTYTVKGLMLHSVGGNIQSAQTWVNAYNRKGYDAAAVHAFVDGTSGEAYQCLPWTMKAGHAGKIANKNYVGVEMCESKYIKYKGGASFTIASKYKDDAKKCAKITYDNSVILFAYLCDYFGINPNGKFSTTKDNGKSITVHTIMSHDEWRRSGHSGHWDPEHYWKGLGTGYTMATFRKAVAETLEENK